MSVATKNPFALLDADDSSRPSSPVAAPAAPAPAAPAARAPKAKTGPAARGGKYYQRGGKPASDISANPNQNGIEEPQEKKFDGRGRGRGGSRGGRGGRGGHVRAFDKHSQTGKVDTEKKINQGWGADEGNAELKAEAAGAVDASAEAWGAPAGGAADEWAAPAATESADGAAPAAADGKPEGRPRREREPEEEDNTLTLDQYLKQQKEKGLEIVPKLETRKANEGTEGNIWKDAVVVDKEEEAYFVGKTKSAPKARAKKEEKVFLEIDARFERPARGGRGGRGGDFRGRGRGGGAERAPRGGRSAATAPANFNVEDQKAFPSLS